ncbi:uncharacterized protein N7458_009739 [Penicillium daleae]|uniref:Uncharacterized protein n=1 Tax=Penicillium daleae TaxID=63821 RepID=A0AAD6BZT5_9EURO|nr:uncharacterized protein N7458_009739 [Penicillium daleae]KAJ5438741.1 hypothetical protein N7458_009739 [Penicillium daleae]
MTCVLTDEKFQAMESSIAYVVSAVTATAAEYSRRSLQWNHDIRIECLCWAILYLGLRLRPKVLKLPAEESEDEVLPRKQQRNFNLIAWSSSFLITVARVLAVHH